MSQKEVTDFYSVVFYLNQLRYDTLWYTDDIDGFLLNKNGKIKSFKNDDFMRKFINEHGYTLHDEVLEIRLDDLEQLKVQPIDCKLILTIWNIMLDAAQSVSKEYLGDSRDAPIRSVYDKLFYGCNILVKEEKYIPRWKASEKRLISRVIDNGYQILLHALEFV